MNVDQFVADPHWGGLIIAYFFLGGIAAGAYATAALARLFGTEEDRRATQAAHYLAFPLVSICGVLLIIDLNRPERFWHMLIASNTFRPIFKWWSPMSVGSWGLSVFGTFSFVSMLKVLQQDGHLRLRFLDRLFAPLDRPGPALVFELLGALSAFFLGAYTGTLLSATNQPVWAQSEWLSALFLASSASTGIAAILLWNRQVVGIELEAATHRLEWLDRWAIALELILIAIFVIDLGAVGPRSISDWPGALIPGVVVPFGLVLPTALVLLGGRRAGGVAPWLILAGGLVLRLAIVAVPHTFLHHQG